MFDYDQSFRADHQASQEEPDPPVTCDMCRGHGSLCDTWGPMHCASCDGKGWLLLSEWLLKINALPPNVRQHWLTQEPPIHHNGGDPHARQRP